MLIFYKQCEFQRQPVDRKQYKRNIMMWTCSTNDTQQVEINSYNVEKVFIPSGSSIKSSFLTLKVPNIIINCNSFLYKGVLPMFYVWT